jgi:hypothetical protein
MNAKVDIRFKGNRAYYLSYAACRWLPIQVDKARLMVATGEAVDVTNCDHI